MIISKILATFQSHCTLILYYKFNDKMSAPPAPPGNRFSRSAISVSPRVKKNISRINVRPSSCSTVPVSRYRGDDPSQNVQIHNTYCDQRRSEVSQIENQLLSEGLLPEQLDRYSLYIRNNGLCFLILVLCSEI